jgi:predicted ATPase
VVTSRDALAPLVATDAARPIMLGLLSTAQAHDLLAGRLGAARVAEHPEAVAEIVARCAGLPLALAIAAARVVTHPPFALTQLAAELRDTAGALVVPDAER